MINQALDIFDKEDWKKNENKKKIIEIFEKINDNKNGGIPEEILKDQKSTNKDFSEFENLMGSDCKTF